MPAGAVNIGSIEADLDLNTGNLERGLARARVAMAAIEGETQRLYSEFQRGSISAADYAARIAELGQVHTDLAGKMQAAYAQIGVTAGGLDIFNKQMKAGADGSGRFGQGLMQLGYIFDDIQYGAQACVNNIAPLVSSFTGSAGLAAGAQIAGVAAYQLYVHMDELRDVMGVGKVRTEAEEMEELGRKTHKTADEQERFNKLKKEQHDIDAMMAKRPEPEQERDAAVGKAIQNADVDKMLKGVVETMRATDRGVKLTPEERDKIGGEVSQATQEGRAKPSAANLWGLMLDTADDKKKHDERVDEAAKKEEADRTAKKAKDLMRDAQTDPGKLKELVTLVEANPGAFPKGTADQLKGLTPEEFKTRDQKKKQKDDDKLADDLTEQGREFRRQQLKEQDDEFKAEQKAKQDERKRAQEWRKENVEVAKMVLPGAEQVAERAVLSGKVNGLKDEDVEKGLQEKLKAAGMTDEDAKAAAKDLRGDAAKGLDEKILRRAQRDEGRENAQTPSKSEIYGTQNLTAKIQSAIGDGDSMKKMPGLMERQIDLLAQIANRKVMEIEVR